MLKQKSFWVLTALFALFFASVLTISINMFGHNEQKLLEYAIKAHAEMAKYLSKAIRENDSDELHKELEHNHLKLECLSEKCEIPREFRLIQSTNNNGDLLEIYNGRDAQIGLRIVTNTHEAFLLTKDHESPKHLKIVAVLFGLSLLMASLYALAIMNLVKTRKIEALLAEKDEFLCMVSHEIKKPLAKAKLALEFMPNGDKKEMAQNAIRKIDTLSSELLNSQKQVLQQAHTKASEIVKMAVDSSIEKESVTVEVKQDFELFCSQTECATAVKNLIENGIKHSKNNKCTVVVGENSLQIRSSGYKIEESIESLCKPFLKGENSRGFGLGLYLVKKTVEKNGLKLLLDYKDGENIFEVIR